MRCQGVAGGLAFSGCGLSLGVEFLAVALEVTTEVIEASLSAADGRIGITRRWEVEVARHDGQRL